MKRIFPFILILMLLSGVLLAQDSLARRKSALRELSLRAKNGEPKALYELAKLHDIGYDTIEKDSARSTALYIMAAEKGYPPARNFIGFRYYNGEIVKKNIDSAIYWINLAATEGDATAASNLGYLLSQAPDVPHDYPQAIYWLRKAVDANLPSALSQLGDLKRMGLGLKPDTAGALALYERAADAGFGDAQFKILAMMGNKWKDLSPDSAMNLGIRYYNGSAPVAGIDLIENVASTGDPRAIAILGLAYSQGKGVAYNHRKSIDYFTRAAQGGNPSAQFILAELLEFFPDEDSDRDAIYWYEEAKKGGVTDSEAAYRLLLSPNMAP